MSFNLSEIGDGALQELVNKEMAQIIKNMDDPNAVELKDRTLTITLKFRPDSSGMAAMAYQVKSSLAPQKARVSKLLYGFDSEGKALINEFRKGALPGQVTVKEDGTVNVPDVGLVDKATGEIMENNKVRVIGGAS